MKIIKTIATLFFVSFLCACAQVPSTGTAIGKKTTKMFQECKISVQFPGNPEELGQKLLDDTNPFKTKNGGSGYLYISDENKIRNIYTSTCFCTDDSRDIALKKIELFMNPYHNKSTIFYDVVEHPLVNLENSGKAIMKTVIPTASSNCLMINAVVSNESDSSIVKDIAFNFLQDMKFIPQVSEDSSSQHKSSSARERLSQIDQLLKDKLITEAEYQKRRLVILESL